jgi:lysophospholipase L1-like esterase
VPDAADCKDGPFPAQGRRWYRGSTAAKEKEAMRHAILGLTLALLLAAAWAMADWPPTEPTPEPTGPPTYQAAVAFPSELPPGCRRHALERFAVFRRIDAAQAPHYDIVLAGDSLVEGWAPLPRAPGRAIGNRGVGCDTTLGLHERLIRDVVAYRPRAAVLLTGVNDLALFNTMPHDRAHHVVQSTLALAMRLQGHGIKPAVVSLLPVRVPFPGLNPRAANVLIRDINRDLLAGCRRLGVPFWDVNQALRDHAGALKEGFTPDGLHLNADGYHELNRQLEPAFRALVK